MQSTSVYDSANKVPHALQELREALGHRHLIFQLVRRDILTRYKRSFLGVAWTMLNPLGIMVVMSFVFSQIFSAVHSYPAFLLTGLVAWNFFSQSTTAAMYSLVWGGGLLQRIYIPRASFGISAIGSGLVNLLLAFVPLVIVMVATGVPIRITAVFMPVSLLFLVCFSLGLGLAISTLAIYFPDVAEMYQIILLAWMYLTPIIYPETAIPKQYQTVLHCNPMYYLIQLWRLPLYDGRWPAWSDIWPAAAIAFGMLVVGWFIFTSKSDEFAYRV
ncbi:MAG TPA: ABC transporter permease [Anaerolineales bacterium]|nr:ABC transporter permease [Anaerolineales bacterium]